MCLRTCLAVMLAFQRSERIKIPAILATGTLTQSLIGSCAGSHQVWAVTLKQLADDTQIPELPAFLSRSVENGTEMISKHLNNPLKR